MDQQQAPTTGMTQKARMHALIGAMCVDVDFRNILFANTEDAARQQAVQSYAGANGLEEFPDEFLKYVLDLLKKPCVSSVKEAMEQFQKLGACPCWPCLNWPAL